MRALTVRQPWAWAIVHGGKDVENRTCNVAGSYRGPVLIHAGLTFDDRQWPRVLLRVTMRADHYGPPRADTRGAVIGVVDLVDVHEPTGWCSPWGDPDAGVHLTLANPRPLPTPIPAKGRLGLWTPDQDLVDAVLEQLVEASA